MSSVPWTFVVSMNIQIVLASNIVTVGFEMSRRTIWMRPWCTTENLSVYRRYPFDWLNNSNLPPHSRDHFPDTYLAYSCVDLNERKFPPATIPTGRQTMLHCVSTKSCWSPPFFCLIRTMIAFVKSICAGVWSVVLASTAHLCVNVSRFFTGNKSFFKI